MNEEGEAIDFDKILNNAIFEIQEGHITQHLKGRLRVSCPRCRERFSLERKIIQKIGNELLTEIRGKWLVEFTAEHKKMLTVMQERYEAEYEQKVQEIQQQYDKKMEHGIKEDMHNKFESLMSDAIQEKITVYQKGVEEIAKQLEELSKKLRSMDFVENPFEGDELFREGDSSTV